MKYWQYILFVSFSLGIFKAQAQKDIKLIANDTVYKTIDPLRPAKAAFYSALLPGAGQVYNKSYWKVPIVVAAIGTTTYFYISNQNKYDSYRDEYKKRLANDPNLNLDYQKLSNDQLIQAQKFYQQNRDLSLLLTVAFYALNIIDANVDAHLQQFNVNEKLTVRPQLQQNAIDLNPNVGLALNFKF